MIALYYAIMSPLHMIASNYIQPNITIICTSYLYWTSFAPFLKYLRGLDNPCVGGNRAEGPFHAHCPQEVLLQWRFAHPKHRVRLVTKGRHARCRGITLQVLWLFWGDAFIGSATFDLHAVCAKCIEIIVEQ